MTVATTLDWTAFYNSPKTVKIERKEKSANKLTLEEISAYDATMMTGGVSLLALAVAAIVEDYVPAIFQPTEGSIFQMASTILTSI
jgi:hypothetical protein